MRGKKGSGGGCLGSWRCGWGSVDFGMGVAVASEWAVVSGLWSGVLDGWICR